MKKILKHIQNIHPQMIAEQLSSVQPINSNIFSIFADKTKIIVPSYFDEIKHKIINETKFSNCPYNDKENELWFEIEFKNYDTFSRDYDSFWNYVNDNYKQDIDKVNQICNENNLCYTLNISAKHQFFYGWTNTLLLKVMQKNMEKNNEQ